MADLPEDAVDLGHDVWWSKVFRGDEWVGIHEWHKEHGEWAAGFVAFTGRTTPEWWRSSSPTWEVLSEDPLTLSPSILCSCGHHGFIRAGKWEPA